ncbi:MAG: hypothetical protein ACYDDZ_14875 [Acidimicrobiales bacterium]
MATGSGRDSVLAEGDEDRAVVLGERPHAEGSDPGDRLGEQQHEEPGDAVGELDRLVVDEPTDEFMEAQERDPR